ncbi:hypothetical protein DIPPA_00625 [Diplonema papillatum]|nr:hypothetical protein DIPPA_00625 [Diplonema papillatum]
MRATTGPPAPAAPRMPAGGAPGPPAARVATPPSQAHRRLRELLGSPPPRKPNARSAPTGGGNPARDSSPGARHANAGRPKRWAPASPVGCAEPFPLMSLAQEEEEIARMAARKQLENELGRALTNVEASCALAERKLGKDEAAGRLDVVVDEGEQRTEISSTLRQALRGRVIEAEMVARSDLAAAEHAKYAKILGSGKNIFGFASSKARRKPAEPRRTPSLNSTAASLAPLSCSTNSVFLSGQSVCEARFFKTENMLGSGAFGQVWEGYDNETGRFVAIKEIRLEAGGRTKEKLKMIVGEVRTMRKLKHPHVVEYLAAERRSCTLSIYMELISGGSISSAIHSLGRGFPERTTKIYTRQICSGLLYLHNSNVAHRDIKGDNVLLEKSTGNVKLADFNSSKLLGNLSINHGMKTLAGTPWFMAPEVIRGLDYGISADVWSLGITIIEMLTGVPPFLKEFECNVQRAMFHIAQLEDPYPVPPSISEAAAAFLRCCLVKNPSERSTVAELEKHPFLAPEAPSPKKRKPASLVPSNPEGKPSTEPSPKASRSHKSDLPKPGKASPSALPSLPSKPMISDFDRGNVVVKKKRDTAMLLHRVDHPAFCNSEGGQPETQSAPLNYPPFRLSQMELPKQASSMHTMHVACASSEN